MSDVQQESPIQRDVAYADEARRCRQLTRHQRYVVRRWWQRLTLSESQAKNRGLPPPWPKGVRAILRRCDVPDAAVLTEGFRKLWQMLDDDDAEAASPGHRRDIRAWACVALIAAGLDNEMPGARPAQAFAGQRKETGKPRVSELRFQQLQQSASIDELTRRMRRALATAGGAPISVVNLADDILLWCREHDAAERQMPISQRVEDRIAFRWANDYFATLGRYAGKD